MAAIADAPSDGLGGDPDAVIRELYSHYAKALHGYVEQFCPDLASADDIVQETFIRPTRRSRTYPTRLIANKWRYGRYRTASTWMSSSAG